VAISQIEPERIQLLNSKPIRKGAYVLYWMQQSQRADFNPALEFAIERGNERGCPVLVAFGLMVDYPDANLRHYAFMLEGLRETQATLARRGITMIVRRGHPPEVAVALARDAALVVCDRGYLRHQKQWREEVAGNVECAVLQVEGDVPVPVEEASDKAEPAARTLRPKLQSGIAKFLRSLPRVKPKCGPIGAEGIDLDLATLKLDRTVAAVSRFYRGGTSEAKRRLRQFNAARYAEDRSAPDLDAVSHLSPYLHFGQISPVWLALQVKSEAYREELIVRRELAVNFVHYTANYDRYESVPAWARVTLQAHAGDPRPAIYSSEELESARTADPYWNAAMLEMTHTGYMHNHMRMYWGKKILEWSASPEQAYATVLKINNKYFLDGRDCNSYANVGWLFGLHDRPWGERPVFGMVRSMTAGGLERKFDIERYVARVQNQVIQQSVC
jgi:deoxyribodipyrimidine photo-lyase